MKTDLQNMIELFTNMGVEFDIRENYKYMSGSDDDYTILSNENKHYTEAYPKDTFLYNVNHASFVFDSNGKFFDTWHGESEYLNPNYELKQ